MQKCCMVLLICNCGSWFLSHFHPDFCPHLALLPLYADYIFSVLKRWNPDWLLQSGRNSTSDLVFLRYIVSLPQDVKAIRIDIRSILVTILICVPPCTRGIGHSGPRHLKLWPQTNLDLRKRLASPRAICLGLADALETVTIHHRSGEVCRTISS